MGSLWSSALTPFAPAVLASPAVAETVAPFIPTRFGRFNDLCGWE